MLLFAPAKINIGLYVSKKRPDGYHNIETVFYPVPLYDVIEVIPSKKIRFFEYGTPSGSTRNENLCMKAYNLLKENFQLPPVDLHLLKKIPVMAGLGGGSSDASAVLLILNKLFSLKLTVKQLESYALKLGSDCPFFINNLPALASGRGEVLKPLNISLKGKIVVIVQPCVKVSTSNAFSKVIINNSCTLKADIQKPVETWKHNIENVFEHSVFTEFPVLSEAKSRLYDAGAVYASMSGSGSALYGIFNSGQNLNLNFPEDWFVSVLKIK